MRTAPRTWPQMCLVIYTWWRHQIETISALLALCVGNSPVTGEFPSQRPVTRGFDIFFDLRPNKPLSKQSRRCWFETPACSLWRHCNEQQRTQDWLQNFGGVFVKLPSEIIFWRRHCSGATILPHLIFQYIICWYIGDMIYRKVTNLTNSIVYNLCLKSCFFYMLFFIWRLVEPYCTATVPLYNLTIMRSSSMGETRYPAWKK